MSNNQAPNRDLLIAADAKHSLSSKISELKTAFETYEYQISLNDPSRQAAQEFFEDATHLFQTLANCIVAEIEVLNAAIRFYRRNAGNGERESAYEKWKMRLRADIEGVKSDIEVLTDALVMEQGISVGDLRQLVVNSKGWDYVPEKEEM